MTRGGFLGVLLFAATAGCVALGWYALLAQRESDVATSFRRDAEAERERFAAELARVKEFGEGGPASAPTTDAQPSSDAEAAAELVRLKARLRELAAERDRLLATDAGPPAAPQTAPTSAGPPLPAVDFSAAADVAAALALDDPAAAHARLGVADAWAPLLKSRIADPGVVGVRALRLWGSLPGTTSDAFAAALGAVGRTDAVFVSSAGRAWAEILRRDGGNAQAVLGAATSDAAPLAVRMAALAAADAGGLPESGVWFAAASARSREERFFALDVLPKGGAPGRATLLAAARAPGVPPEFPLHALAALLPDAEADEAPALATLAADSPGAALFLRDKPVSTAARPFVTAAFADLLFVDPIARGYVAAVVGASAEAPPRDLAARVFADRLVRSALHARARARRPEPPRVPDDVRALLGGLRLSDARDVVEALDLLGDAERAEAAGRLAAIGHPTGVSELARLCGASDPAVRIAALGAAAAAGAHELVGDVARRIGDPLDPVRFAAADALDLLAAPLAAADGVPLLAEARSGVAEPVIAALARHPDRAATLAALLGALEADDVREPFAASALAATLAGEQGFDRLADLARHPADALRAAVVEALAERDDDDLERALGLFDRAAGDASFIVRVRAAHALGRVKDELARARLVQLTNDPSAFVREAAVLALSGHAPERVVAVARRALDDVDADVRFVARVALVRLGVVERPAVLVAGLRDPWVAGLARGALTRLVGPFTGEADAARLVEARFGAEAPATSRPESRGEGG